MFVGIFELGRRLGLLASPVAPRLDTLDGVEGMSGARWRKVSNNPASASYIILKGTSNFFTVF